MLRTIIVSLVVAMLAGTCVLSADGRPPNLILIMADDFGYENIGANGGTSYRTPHLDALAAAGMRFEHCYVQPLCTPTRVQLMTGLYNVRNYTRFGELDRQATTFANLLQEAGYATAIAGKWQLGRGRKLPRRFGFDESCLWQHTRRPPRYANPGLEYNGAEKNFEGGEYGPELVNEFALDFITRNKERPFLLYYPMILTHSPFQPTPESKDWDPAARGERVNNHPKHFADMLAYMDKMIGRLLEKLDELGIRENSLVIFLGDNGNDRRITSQLNGRKYPGGKGLTNVRGMHVPLVARWPGKIPAGKVNTDLIDSTDFLPTLCEAAGIDVSKSTPLDGRSFLAQLTGERGQPRDWVYYWYAPHGGPKADVEFAMNTSYKLYRDGTFVSLQNGGLEELPVRTEELSGEAAKAAAMLQVALDQYSDVRPANLQKPAEQPRRARRKGAEARARGSGPSTPKL